MANAFLVKPLVPASIVVTGAQPGFDLSTGALPAGASFSRASAGARFNNAGALVFEAQNTPRFDHDPVTRALRGLLIEPAATNIIGPSQDATAWQLGAVTATANAATAPDGSNTADTITGSGSGATFRFARPNGPWSGASAYAAFFFKAGTQRFVQITFGSNAGQGYANYDLQAGTVTAVSGAIATITPAGNGWYRCAYLLLAPANGGFDGPYLILIDSGTAGRAANSGAPGTTVHVWQADGVEASQVTSPIAAPTTAASSRSADILTLNWGSLGAPDGSATIRYTFDDASTQDVSATISSGVASVPTDLARPRLRSALLVSPVIASAGAVSVGTPANLLNDYAGVTVQALCNAGANSAAQFVIDLGVDTPIDTLLMFGVELFPAAGTLTVDYATAAQGAFTGVYATDASGVAYAGSATPTSGKGVSYWSLAAPVTARYLRLTYAAGAAGRSLRASRLVIGKRIRLERNFSHGAAFGVRDLGSVDFSRRGVLQRSRGAKLRTVGLTFSNVRRDELEAQLLPLLEQLGNTETVALVTDPVADAQRQNRCYFGPLVGDLSATRATATRAEAKINLVSLF